MTIIRVGLLQDGNHRLRFLVGGHWKVPEVMQKGERLSVETGRCDKVEAV